jgi:uncharacterized protein
MTTDRNTPVSSAHIRRLRWTSSARALLALMCLVLISPLAAQVPDACPPRPEPVPTELSGEALAAGYAQGILWEVAHPSSAPSHLFGTLHVDDPRVTVLAPEVEAVFARAERIVTETVLDEEAAARYVRHMYFADGRRLDLFLNGPLYYETVRQLARHGVPQHATQGLKPWAVFTILARPKPAADGEILDLVLQRRAALQEKTLEGLETVEELVAALDSLPLDDQIEILVDTVCSRDLIQQQQEELIERYLERDLAGLMELNWRYQPADQEVFDRFMESVLYARNERMAERLQPHLDAGRAFIAVGALHLPGEGGLLQRLEAQGYQVRPVY